MSRAVRDDSFLREVVLETTAGIVTVDARNRIVFVNDAFERMVDCDRAALVDRPVAQLFESGSDTVERARDVTDVGSVVSATLDCGESESVPVTVSPDEVEYRGTTYSTLTVTRREPTFEEIETGERLVRQLFDHRKEALFVFDPSDASIVTCNRRAEDLLGGPVERSDTRSARDLTADPESFASFLADVAETNRGRREEFTWLAGSAQPVEVIASPIEAEGGLLVLANVRDVSERIRLREERRRRTAALEVAAHGIAILDDSLEHTVVNEAYASRFEYGSPEAVRGTPLDAILESAERFEREIRPAVESGRRWEGTATCNTAAGATVEATLVCEQLDDGSLVIAVGGNHERGHEAAPDAEARAVDLTALGETRRQLSAADDPASIAETTVESLGDALGHDLACLRFATDEDSLEIAAMTPGARELIEENPGFEFALSEAGRAFRTGERIVEQPQSAGAVSDLLTARVHCPLGEHGVLTVATADGTRVPPESVDVLEFLAGGVEVTLDRIDRQRQLRAQGTALREQQDHLETVVDLTALTQETIRELLAAETPEEVETVVCGNLSSSEVYDGAWIADLDLDERIRVSESADVPESDVSAIDGASVPELLGRTTDELAGGATEAIPLDRSTVQGEAQPGPGPIVGVPLTDGDRIFGILAVRVSSDHEFTGVAERNLEALGETISFALGSLENERLLLADEAVQLEFQVTDPSCLAVSLSDRLDTRVSMRRTVQNTRDEHLSYVHVEDTDPDAAIAAATSTDGVRDCRVINDHDEDCLIEVTRPQSGAEVMMEYGATMRRAEAESGDGTLVLEAPDTVNVRRLAEAYQSYNPESTLLSKQTVDRPVRTAKQLRADIKSTLTEKQFSAITSAFYSGYYEWPRESTAEEVADSMEITASTLHQHLRRAHKKVLIALLENASTVEGRYHHS